MSMSERPSSFKRERRRNQPPAAPPTTSSPSSPLRPAGPSVNALMDVVPSSPAVAASRENDVPPSRSDNRRQESSSQHRRRRERQNHIKPPQDQQQPAEDTSGKEEEEEYEGTLHRLASQSQWGELDVILRRYLGAGAPGSVGKSSGVRTHDTHGTHETNPNTPTSAPSAAASRNKKRPSPKSSSSPDACIDEDHPSVVPVTTDDDDEADTDAPTRHAIEMELSLSQGPTASLPLHLASRNGAPTSTLRLLVQAYPSAAVIADGKGDLPIHLLRQYGDKEAQKQRIPIHESVNVESIEILLQPLCSTSSDATQPPITGEKQLERLFRLRAQTDDDLTAAVDAAKRVLSSKTKTAMGADDLITVACVTPSSFSGHLPLHIAAEFGVSYDTLLGLVQSNSAAAKEALNMQSPLEQFENGRAGKEAQDAEKSKRRSERVIESATFGLGSSSEGHSQEDCGRVMESFRRRSDLLFAMYPNAEPSSLQRDEESTNISRCSDANRKAKKRRSRQSRNVPYRHDSSRMRRIETLIQKEASSGIEEGLSLPIQIFWSWICDNAVASDDKRENFVGSVGRVIDGLGQQALWKLSLVASPVPKLLLLGNGKSVPEEAICRRPNASFDQMLRSSSQHGWQFCMTGFLTARDALSYSRTCRRTRQGSVRILPEIDLNEPDQDFTFEIGIDGGLIDSPLPWQDLAQALITPDCTHTVYVLYDLEVSEGFDPGRSGGLVVCRDDLTSDIRQEDWRSAPTGRCIVAREQKPTSRVGFVPGMINEACLSFHYQPGARYSLFSYGTLNADGVSSSISITNVRIKQLVHCEDRARMTPLHVLLSSHPEGCSLPDTITLRRQVGALTAAGFGSMGIVPLHYALKVNSSQKVLRALIAENPSALLETDREGRTPLHACFLLKREEPPSEGIVKALLTNPGENAAKVKDSHERLPIHIAAERGASLEILKVLVDVYPDSCYRVNLAGDLPLHLLVRSGTATTESVELLIEPIMRNETICKMGGSIGCQLPLHIASEYSCAFEILEALLSSYPEAATIARSLPSDADKIEVGDVKNNTNDDDKYEKVYAIDLFERTRELNTSGIDSMHPSGNRRKSYLTSALSSKGSIASSDDPHSLSGRGDDAVIEDISPVKTPHKGRAKRRGSFGATSMSKKSVDSLFDAGTVHSTQSRDLAVTDMLSADFDLRSDLIFVYGPLIKAPGGLPYRHDRRRVKRLTNLIRREAIQIAERHGEDVDATGRDLGGNVEGDGTPPSNVPDGLTDMARLAWCFLCSHNDTYINDAKATLRGLSTSAVSVLAQVPNPHSTPLGGIPIVQSASTKCKELIQSRLRFVGRYVLDQDAHPLHKSDSCMVIRAVDHSCVEAYNQVREALRNAETIDEDKAELHDNFEQSATEDDIGTIVHHTKSNYPSKDLVDAFVAFAMKAGINEDRASAEINALLGSSSGSSHYDRSSPDSSDSDVVSELGDHPIDACAISTRSAHDDDVANKDAHRTHRKAFVEFCQGQLFNKDGTRSVCIKFMRHRSQFELEVAARSRLDLASGSKWFIAPILEDFDVDRIKKKCKRESTLSPPRTTPEGEYNDYAVPIKGYDTGSISTNNRGMDSKDELFALHSIERNASIPFFSLFRYAIVLPGGDKDLDAISQHEQLKIGQIRQYTLQVALALEHLHENSQRIHGDLKPANAVRFGDRITLVDLDSSCFIGAHEQGHGKKDHLGGSHHKFSTGVLPPEMIFKIDLETEPHLLEDYQDYHRDVVDDARDLSRLNPDDVETVSRCIECLLERADAAKNMGSASTSLRSNMGQPLAGLKDPSVHWKDVISDALISIDFQNLPETLSSCNTLVDFASNWERLNSSAALWEKFCPRLSLDGRYSYVLKTYDERLSRGTNVGADDSNLPYDLVPASASADIWALGLLLYSLCSGGNLFHVGHNGDLRSFSAYAADLHGWTKESADSIVRSNVDDPLAQDLLTKLVVPEQNRYKTMEQVLCHPFFGDHTALEAQQILERHEEQELLAEETLFFPQMITASRKCLVLGVEKQNRIIFEEERLVVPTGIVVLPYELQVSSDASGDCPPELRSMEADRPSIKKGDNKSLELAAFIGLNLLEINLATARLTFWLTMRKNLARNSGSEFKHRLKGWLKRARSEPCVDVAEDILSTIGLGPEYLGICKEILEKGDATSHARAYIKNPMGAAKEAIDRSSSALLECYSSQYVYLIDEFSGSPTVFSASTAECEDPGGLTTTYPIAVDSSANLFQPLLLQFMIVTSMASLARNKFQGLACMLGMPPTSAVPDDWLRYHGFLVHRASIKTATIAEFGVLQDCMRKKEDRAMMRKLNAMQDDGGSTAGTSHPTISTISSFDSDNAGQKGLLMLQLETFFREYDPRRTFSGLRRVSDGREYNGYAFWVSDSAVEILESQMPEAISQQRLKMFEQEQGRLVALQRDLEGVSLSPVADANTATHYTNEKASKGKSRLEPQLSGFVGLGDVERHRPPPQDEYGRLNDEFEEEEEEEPLIPHAFGSPYAGPLERAMQHSSSQAGAATSGVVGNEFSLPTDFGQEMNRGRNMSRKGSMGHMSAGKFSFLSGQHSIASSAISDRRKKMRNTAKSQPRMQIQSVRGMFSNKSERSIGAKGRSSKF